MGIPMGKNQKVSANAMQSRLNQNIKMSSQKERMLRKLAERRAQREMEQINKKVEKSNYLEKLASNHEKIKIKYSWDIIVEQYLNHFIKILK